MDKNNLNENETVKDKEKKDEEEIEVLELWEPHADEITDAKDRHIKMSKKSTNKIVIVLVLVGALLTIWYAVFAQPLAFDANQETSNAKEWNIGFVDMQLSDVVGGAKELGKPSFTSTKANFYVSLTGPGDKIVYDLTIKNSGMINAKVENIDVTLNNKPGDQIIYSVGGIDEGDELKVGESTHMTVTAMYNRNATTSLDSVRKDMWVVITYVEA